MPTGKCHLNLETSTYHHYRPVPQNKACTRYQLLQDGYEIVIDFYDLSKLQHFALIKFGFRPVYSLILTVISIAFSLKSNPQKSFNNENNIRLNSLLLPYFDLCKSKCC